MSLKPGASAGLSNCARCEASGETSGFDALAAVGRAGSFFGRGFEAGGAAGDFDIDLNMGFFARGGK